MSALSDLYSLIPEPEGFILGRDLCAVFATYEARRGTQLLQPAERDALQLFARENADARVDGEVLVALIGQLLMTTGQEDAPATPVSRAIKADATRPEESAATTGQATITTPQAASTPISHIPRRRPLASTAPGDGKSTITLPPPSSYRTDHRGRRGSDGASPLVDGVTGKSPTPHAHTPTRSTSALSTYPAASSTTPTTAMGGAAAAAAGGITRPRPPRSGRTSTGGSTTTTGTPPSTSAAAGKGGNGITTTTTTNDGRRTSVAGGTGGGRPSSRVFGTTTTAGISSPSTSAAGTIGAETGEIMESNQPPPPSQPASPDLPALMMGVDSEVSMLDETSFVGFSHHHQQALHADGIGGGGLAMEMDDVLDSGRRHGHGHGSRLDRISTTSTISLTASHDAFEALKRENADLIRRKAELVRQVQVIGTETEAQMADLQEALDGARAELAVKKREDKDSRTREAQLGTQICTLELEMQHLQQQLSTSRESYSMQQRMLQDSNAESARLRDVVLGKEADVAGLKLAIEAYEDEKRSWQDQIETLQATNATLQAGLQAAQQAARTLERRKAENQELQQTIKRLTHELDLIRTRQTAAGSGHRFEPTDASEAGTKDGEPGSRVGMGVKSLGDELRSRFVKHGAGDSDDDDDDHVGKGKTVIRTVTYRTERVVRRREPRERQEDQEASDESEPEVSFVEEEIMREYTDAGVETDPLPAAPAAPLKLTMTSTSIQTDETHHGALPPYSPRSDTTMTAVENALAQAHPAIEDVFGGVVGLEQHHAVAAAYADMSLKLGSRCTVFEEKLKLKQEEAMKRSEQGSWSLATSVAGTQISTTLDSRPGLGKSLGYLSAAVLVAGIVGHYLGWWSGYPSENELVLHDYKLLYGHLPIRQFLPNTTGVKILAGGVKQFTGRTPI